MNRILPSLIALLVFSCASGEIEPIPLYEEDGCSFCRMAISDPRFAGEILTTTSEVYKFDDLGCLRAFRESRTDAVPTAIFVIDYDTGIWLNHDDAVVTRTGIQSPMASGLIATGSAVRAAALAREYPPEVE